MITAHPTLPKMWARYCTGRLSGSPVVDTPFITYCAGYALLTGPHAAEWAARGFDEVYKAVRNSSREAFYAAN